MQRTRRATGKRAALVNMVSLLCEKGSMGADASSPSTPVVDAKDRDDSVSSLDLPPMTNIEDGFPATVVTNLFSPHFVAFASERLGGGSLADVRFSLPPDFTFSDAVEDQVPLPADVFVLIVHVFLKLLGRAEQGSGRRNWGRAYFDELFSELG